MSLTARTTTGLIWNISEQFAKRGVSIVVTLLLAKFLVPEDFGLVAMMAVFLALGQTLMEAGFRDGLIRQENTTQKDYATAFYGNLMLGGFSYGALFFLAPFIAEFYGESRLVELIRLASLNVVIMSFQVVQVASLSRKLNFKAQLKASFPASIVSGIVAVYLAYLGFGVRALISQILLNAFIHTLLLWWLEGWRPTREFSWASLRELYSFGYKLFLSGALDTVFRNLYVIVIAKLFSAPVAGLYFFAQKVRELLVQQMVTAIQRVSYPAMASIQNDSVRLKEGYKKIIIITSMIVFPVVLFVGVASEPLFELFLPEKWQLAVPYFQLLCVASVLLPIHSINLNLLKVKGRSDLFFYLEIIKKSVNAIVLLATCRYGVYAILLGQILTSFAHFFTNSYYSGRLIGYGVFDQIKDFGPVLFVSFFCAAAGFLVLEAVEASPLVVLIAVVLLMFLMFFALSFVFSHKQYSVLKDYLVAYLKFRNIGSST
ncbi:lipopolysaccharide biosynthesis protein [Marinobacteraceae bacterium S3BR75-40.1]